MRSPCCLCVPPNVASQQLGKHIPMATNTHTTTEKLLDGMFSVRFVSYQITHHVVKEKRVIKFRLLLVLKLCYSLYYKTVN
jgi:hypothetical protein